jgi:hypothetical protein
VARIRTIKPEFFTSEDIVGLTPLARLLYVAIWCEADKEGRLTWKPVTFKLRYFPGDNCDIASMCKEIVDAGLVVLYGDGLAVVPSFKAHQHINPRESDSQLPEPVAIPTRKARVVTRQSRDSDAQGGREGKGKEGKDSSADAKNSRASSLPENFYPNDAGVTAAEAAGLNVKVEVANFSNHHASKGSKFIDWQAAWRTWMGKAIEFGRGKAPKLSGEATWLAGTPFTDIFEAQNAGCYQHNAEKFRQGAAA